MFFNKVEEEHKVPKLKKSMTEYQLLASAIQVNPQKQNRGPLEAYKLSEQPPLLGPVSKVA